MAQLPRFFYDLGDYLAISATNWTKRYSTRGFEQTMIATTIATTIDTTIATTQASQGDNPRNTP